VERHESGQQHAHRERLALLDAHGEHIPDEVVVVLVRDEHLDVHPDAY